MEPRRHGVTVRIGVNPVRRGQLLADHAGDLPAPLGGPHEQIVGHHVELLLRLAVDACGALGAQHPVERPVRQTGRDRLAGQRDVEDQRVQLAARVRVAAAFLDEEAGERGPVREHDVSLRSGPEVSDWFEDPSGPSPSGWGFRGNPGRYRGR
jgi:hypothetical protein